MENFPFNSYSDSVNSSPRSRDVDCETASLDDPNPTSSSYKVKFMCSYGGKILPRPHDNQLTYVGGDTKIITVDRNVRFSSLLLKLNSISDTDVGFKYQLPGEDLDALISVTNDEDLEHMMLEYDRLYRASIKPARMRLFLFPVSASAAASFGTSDTKSERQWFVDALNSAQIRNLEDSSPPSAAVENPDFLFGFDKSGQLPAAKLQDPAPVSKVSEGVSKDVTGGGSDYGSEDRYAIGDPVVSPAAIHRHMQELQIMQNVNQEQVIRRNEEINQSRAYYGAPPPQPMPVQPQYWHEPQMTTGGYGAPPSINAVEQPIYLISTPSGVYQAPPPTNQAAQPYYTMQRPMYNTMAAAAPPLQSIQQANIGGYTEGMGMSMMRPLVGAVANQQGYAHVSYEGARRQQVYYTTTAPPLPYQAVGELRQGGGGSPMHQEGKINNPNSMAPSQTSPM